MASFYDQISANKRNSYFLLAAVFAIVFAMVYAFSYIFIESSGFGFILGAILSSVYIAISYFLADRAILSLSGARLAQKNEFPYLLNVVEGLSIAAGIPVPKIYVIDDPALNAFAVGTSPDKASVAFTSGLLQTLNRAELEGVAAHEISHIKNYDSRMATLVVICIGLVAVLADLGARSLFFSRRRGEGRGGGVFMLIGLAVLILAPIAAHLVRLALSRQREYLADASGAQLTRYPEGLASALEKIGKMGSRVQTSSDATASLYFANPLSSFQLLSTHPPLQERIKRLREM